MSNKAERAWPSKRHWLLTAKEHWKPKQDNQCSTQPSKGMKQCHLHQHELTYRLSYWGKTEQERQISYDITCMWNLKHDTKEHTYETETGEGKDSGILAWKFHGQRNLVGYSPWSCKESNRTEWLNHHHHETEIASQTKNSPMVAKGEWEEWTGSVGLVDAKCYIQSGQTARSYYTAQGTLFNTLW